MTSVLEIALKHNDRCITWMHNDTLIADDIPYMLMRVLRVFREYDTKDDMFEVTTTAITVEASKLLAEWITTCGLSESSRTKWNDQYTYNILALLDAANYYYLDEKLFDMISDVKDQYKAWEVVNVMCKKYPEDYLDAWYNKLYDNAVSYIYENERCWYLHLCNSSTINSPRGEQLMTKLVKSDKRVTFTGMTCGAEIMQCLKDKDDLDKKFLIRMAKSYEKDYPNVSNATYWLFKNNDIDEKLLESRYLYKGVHHKVLFFNSDNHVFIKYTDVHTLTFELRLNSEYNAVKLKFSLYLVYTQGDNTQEDNIYITGEKLTTHSCTLLANDFNRNRNHLIDLNSFEKYKHATYRKCLKMVVEECEDVTVDY